MERLQGQGRAPPQTPNFLGLKRGERKGQAGPDCNKHSFVSHNQDQPLLLLPAAPGTLARTAQLLPLSWGKTRAGNDHVAMHAVISGIQQSAGLSQAPQVPPSQNLLKFSENGALSKVLFSVLFGDITSTLPGVSPRRDYICTATTSILPQQRNLTDQSQSF